MILIPRYEDKFPPIKLTVKAKLPKITFAFVVSYWLLGVACQDPASKYRTETVRFDSLREELFTMRVWFMMLDDSSVQKRYNHLVEQDSLINLPNLADHLPRELGLSLIEYRGIGPIYKNYLDKGKQQKQRLDTLDGNRPGTFPRIICPTTAKNYRTKNGNRGYGQKNSGS